MKTKQQVEEMKENIQKKIDNYGSLAREANQGRDQCLYEYYHKIYGNAVAQYNILLEVLNG